MKKDPYWRVRREFMEIGGKGGQKLGGFNVFLLNMLNEHMRLQTPYCYAFVTTRSQKIKLWLIHQVFCRLSLEPHRFMRKIDDKHFRQFTYEALKTEFDRRTAKQGEVHAQ